MRVGRTIYLDHQATTPLDRRVLDAMGPYHGESFGNPHSSDHSLGWEAAHAVEKAAAQVARLIGADPDEITFTSGATESNNMALLGLGRRVAGDRRRILVSAIEHKCVLASARVLEEQYGFVVEQIPVDRRGLVELAALDDMLDEDVLAVSVMAVNNEVGTIQDIGKISDSVRRHGAVYHCDAAQAPTALPTTKLAALTDILTLSGHKMYGPKGVGAIFITRGLQNRIEPLIYGGGQQNELRSGTLPVPLCVGMGAAAELLVGDDAEEERRQMRRRRDTFVHRLRGLSWPVSLIGPEGEARHPGNANICFHGLSAHEILGSLQPRLSASTGSACTSGIPEPSHVLRATGLDSDDADATVRFSLGRGTTDEDVEQAVELIEAVVAELSRTERRQGWHRSSIAGPALGRRIDDVEIEQGRRAFAETAAEDRSEATLAVNSFPQKLNGWVASFLKENPTVAERLSAHGIFDDASYAERESGLDRNLRHRLGLFRVNHFIGANCDDPCQLARAAPPWLVERELATLGLPVRASNVFRDRVKTVCDLAECSPETLLSWRNFGRKSMQDTLKALTAALSEGPPRAAANQLLTGARPSLLPFRNDADSEVPDLKPDAWGGAVDLFETLLAAASEFHGADTVGEALRLDLPKLAETLGIVPTLESLPIQDLTSRCIVQSVNKRLASMLASMSSKERLILEKRLFVPSPHKLRELGEQIGVTRERVRQIEQRLLVTVEEAVGQDIRIVATFLHDKLGPIVSVAEFERLIAQVLNDDSLREPAIDLICRMIKAQLKYTCVNSVCFSETAADVVATLRSAAREVADDVGLIDEEALRDHLPDAEWERFFPQLLELCQFPRIERRPALRDSGKARVKATLLEIGRAATKEEIAEMSDFEPLRVGSHLSVIPSVVRVDKTHWGLIDWVEDVYEGIPAEIIQRINEDGGATPLERLLEELPRLFGVTKPSVRAYVGTPQFTIQDGYVSLATDSSITFRDLEDVIDGRDASGNPYWTFLVEDRYFEGYSLLGFPPELARELGCEPNGKTFAFVTRPEGSGKLSVIWRLSSTTGASLGHLADPLERLGVSSGERVRVVIKGHNAVDLRRDSTTTFVKNDTDTLADSLLERIENRRKVI